MSATTLAAAASATLEVRKSRFIAHAVHLPVATQAAARIAELGDAEARHNCWAWRVGQQYRFHDADEPSGTAGKPILAAIDGQGLDQVLVLVVRWFGGIKLGAGGLMRAYGQAAADALRLAPRRELVELGRLAVEIPFGLRNLVEQAVRQLQGRIEDAASGSTGLRLLLELPRAARPGLVQRIRDLSSGRALFLPDP